MAKRREKGDGSIYQRESDQMWVAYVRLDIGKRKYVYAKTRSEVAKKLKSLQREVDQKTIITARPETVEAFLYYWLDIHKVQIKESTYICYKKRIATVCPHIGSIKLQKLAGDHLQKMYQELQHNQRQSPNTVKLIHKILKAAFKDAIRWKRLSSNPCLDISPPKSEKHDVKALTPEQVEQLFIAAQGQKLECFLTLALATGLRKGELVGLHWSDIDMDEKTLKVNSTASYLPDENGKYRYVETCPKTKSSKRTIVLAQFAINVLKAHKIKQLETRLQAGTAWTDKGLVFCGSTGDHPSLNVLDHHFKKVLKDAGLAPMRIHDLRHSAATMLLKMKVPAKVVQEILGHSSIVVTMDIYGHVLPGMQDDAISQLDKLFLGSQ